MNSNFSWPGNKDEFNNLKGGFFSPPLNYCDTVGVLISRKIGLNW